MGYIVRNLIKSFLIAFLISTSVAFYIGDYFYKLVKDYDINKDLMKIENVSTFIFDLYGNKIGEFQKTNKSTDRYHEIPKIFVQAAIATEDRAFFQHSGIDVSSIFRALLVNLQSGETRQGGSTITQQLIKQVYLDPSKNIDRKKDEAILSTILESTVTKRDIMAHYLNHNFYGNQAYGLSNALYTYFDQSFEEFLEDDPDIQAAKAALLIGLPNAPSIFDPYVNPDAALKRRNSVLTNMYVEGYIERNIYETAKKRDLLILEKPKSGSVRFFAKDPEAVTLALLETSKRLGKPIEEVMYGGYRIETTFDRKLYNILRKHIKSDANYPINPYATEGIQGAGVFLDARNGRILAITGNKNEVNEILTLNRAYQSKRQPGSSLKPVLPYGAALETGKFSKYSQLSCKQNYDGYVIGGLGCFGNPTMHDSIKWSLNPPAVWTLEQIGIDYARKYTEMLGIKLHKDDIYLPMALGGMKEGVTPFELADAYQVFLNEGKRAEAHFITRVYNKEGKVVFKEPETKQLINPQNANDMKEMLRSVVENGTGTDAKIPGFKIGGKTGTNELADGSGNSDVWFVGVSENVVGVIWMGYDKNEGNNKIPKGVLSYYPARKYASIGKELLPEIDKLPRKVKVPTIELNVYSRLDTNSLQLKWSRARNAEFIIYRNEEVMGITDISEFEDLSIESGNSYKYRVEGYNKKDGKLIFRTEIKNVKVN